MPPRKNLQEHFDDGTLDLSLSDLQEVPVRDIVSFRLKYIVYMLVILT